MGPAHHLPARGFRQELRWRWESTVGILLGSPFRGVRDPVISSFFVFLHACSPFRAALNRKLERVDG